MERLHMTTKSFYRRRFLNRRGFHPGAYVLAECKIETRRPGSGPAQHTVNAEFRIADCGRVASLDSDVDSEPSADNALRKARLLRDTLIDFTASLEATVADWHDLKNS